MTRRRQQNDTKHHYGAVGALHSERHREEVIFKVDEHQDGVFKKDKTPERRHRLIQIKIFTRNIWKDKNQPQPRPKKVASSTGPPSPA